MFILGKYLKRPSKILISIGSRLPCTVSDEFYLSVIFKDRVGYDLNLKNPKTFNEKIQWLKLYDRNPEYIRLVDKIEVKKWVSERIGEKYVIPTIGEWNSFGEINFSEMPRKFVLKCTHDSGGVFICKDKSEIDYNSLKKSFKKKLNHNFYGYGREWPYKMIKPRLLAEELIQEEGSSNNGVLMDYKFMCFNGDVRCVFVCTGRYSQEGLHVTFFDKDWNRLPFERKYPSSQIEIDRPTSLARMIDIAQKLSSGIPFVRVDLYESNNRIYFGEMTFYPGSGFEPFYPKEYDYRLGDWIHIHL